MYKIPFSGRNIKYTEKEIKAVVETMENAKTLTQGEKLISFEKSFNKFLSGGGKSFAVGSATDALEIAAQLCQFKSGEEFIIPAHTYTASCYPFIKHGGTPKWADIDSSNRVISLESIKKCINPKTRAIVVVHLYGYVVDMDPILKLAKEYNLLVIEDAAQSIGSIYNGKRAGCMSDIGIFSFHSHKNITTLGEGGMLWIKDLDVAEKIPLIRHNGHCNFNFNRPDYWIPAMGNVDLPEINGDYVMPNNYCLGEVECTLGEILLSRIDIINREKRQRAINFIDSLKEFKNIDFHRVNSERHNYHLLVAQIKNGTRDEFIRLMSNKYSIQSQPRYSKTT